MKIRELSLRKWILISLGLNVLAILCVIVSGNYAGFRLSLITGQLSTLLFVTSLAVYAVNSMSKVKVILIIAAAAFLIYMYGMFDAFSNRWVVFSEVPYHELTEYYSEQIYVYTLVQNLALAAAFVVGIFSLQSRYRIPWIIFTLIFALSFLNALFYAEHTFSVGDYNRFTLFIGLLQLVGLVMALVKGGKNVTVNESPALASESRYCSSASAALISKSESLFKLKELLDSGILTTEEFEAEKAKILNL